MNNLKRNLAIGDWVYVNSMAHPRRNLMAVSSGSGMSMTASGTTLKTYFPLGINPPAEMTINAAKLDVGMTAVAMRLQEKMNRFLLELDKQELALLDELFV